MSNYNPQMNLQTAQIQNQYPYGSNSMLLGNTPYENYMGRISNSPKIFIKLGNV